MSILRTKLMLHKNITNGTKDETQTHTPSGEFSLVKAAAFGAYDLNCVVKVEFDGEIIFSGKGAEVLMGPLTRTGDGVKIVKLILDAVDLTSGSVVLGCEADFEEEV